MVDTFLKYYNGYQYFQKKTNIFSRINGISEWKKKKNYPVYGVNALASPFFSRHLVSSQTFAFFKVEEKKKNVRQRMSQQDNIRGGFRFEETFLLFLFLSPATRSRRKIQQIQNLPTVSSDLFSPRTSLDAGSIFHEKPGTCQKIYSYLLLEIKKKKDNRECVEIK